MTNQDPIADREAKITALQASIDKARECLWRVCGQQSFRLKVCIPARPGVDDDCVIADGLEAGKEAVALMRSAPDGDAKLLELRDWVAKMPAGAFQGTTRMRLVDEIDRLLSKPSEPAPAAEIDRLHAENARLQADLAAARADQAAMARRELEAVQSWMFQFRPAGYPNIQAVASFCTDRLAALPAQQPEPKPDAEARVAHLERDLAAARADQAAMARRELEWMRNWCWNSWGTVPGSAADRVFERRLAALPAQQPEPEPKPDAATRDGDEVLRGFLARDDSRTIDEAVMRELCRRELARGGK